MAMSLHNHDCQGLHATAPAANPPLSACRIVAVVTRAQAPFSPLFTPADPSLAHSGRVGLEILLQGAGLFSRRMPDCFHPSVDKDWWHSRQHPGRFYQLLKISRPQLANRKGQES